MKIRRSTLIPAVLLVYLAGMSVIGWHQYSIGAISATYFWGVIALTLGAIVLLRLNLLRRERLRDRRTGNPENDNKQ